MEANPAKPGNPAEEKARRPFLLTVICLFAFVFFGLITVLFLFSLFFTSSITDMVYRYAPENSTSGMKVLGYTLGGFLLHAVSFSGIIFIWRLRRLGYKLFGISALIIASYQLFLSQISPFTTSFYIVFILAFGLFYKKLK